MSGVVAVFPGPTGGGGGGGGGADGVLVPWADLDLSVDPISRIDMAESYPVWVTSGATHTNLPTGGWDGGPCAKLTPTLTGDGYCCLGAFNNLHRGGALAIRRLNIRMELYFGSAFGAGQQSKSDNKFIIVHCEPTNTAGSTHRPMLNIWPEGGTLSSLAVACGTLKQFNPTPPPDEYFPGSGESDFYFGDSGTTGGPGNKPIATPQWLDLQYFVAAEAIPGYPDGRIAARAMKRDGTVLTLLDIPYTYDSAWSLGDFINEVQVIGGYLNGNGTSNANDYQLISGLTLAANRDDFLPARSGFLL